MSEGCGSDSLAQSGLNRCCAVLWCCSVQRRPSVFRCVDRVFRCIAYRVYAGSRIYPDGIRRFELTSLVLLLIYTRVCFLPGLGLFIRASRGVSFCWNDKSTHCSSTKMAIDSRSPWFDVAKLQFLEKPTGSLTDVSPRLMMSSHTHCL